MKRIIIFTGLILALLSPRISQAMSLSAGPYLWYAWWQPAFETELRGEKGDFNSSIYSSFSMEPTILYGPVLSLRFTERFSWSLVFLTGEFNSSSASYASYEELSTSDQAIRKYEADTAFNFTINDVFGWFFGFKYQYYSYKNERISEDSSYESFNNTMHTASIAFGISLKFHLFGNMFLIWNGSGLYQRLFFEQDYTSTYYMIQDTTGSTYGVVGANTTLSLAYYFSGISTTVSLGFRYQVFYIEENDSGTFYNFYTSVLGGEIDHFYGVTFAAVYTFDF